MHGLVEGAAFTYPLERTILEEDNNVTRISGVSWQENSNLISSWKVVPPVVCFSVKMKADLPAMFTNMGQTTKR